MSAGALDTDQTEAYAARLRAWNDSPTYHAEVRFLQRLLDPRPDERILDVGCGTGACLEYLAEQSGAAIDGYDVNRFVTGEPDWFRTSLAALGRYDKIYLLHSLAHVDDAGALLTRLVADHLTADGRLYVITPNVEFGRHLRSQPQGAAYVPDPTVREHYTLARLVALLLSARLDVTISGFLGQQAGGHHERLFAVAVRPGDTPSWPRTC